MSEVSCRVADLWRGMAKEEKAPFFAMAHEERRKAALLLPPTAPLTERRETLSVRLKQSKRKKRRPLPDNSEKVQISTSPAISERSLPLSSEASTPPSLCPDLLPAIHKPMGVSADFLSSMVRGVGTGPGEFSPCHCSCHRYETVPNFLLGHSGASEVVSVRVIGLDNEFDSPSCGEFVNGKFEEVMRQRFSEIFGF